MIKIIIMYKRNKNSEVRDMGMDCERFFEERNRGLDICSTRTSLKERTG